MKKKLVVIGAGMASGRMLEHLFEAAPDAWDVTLFNAEPRGNYNRIMLSPVLSGEKSYGEIVTHDAPEPVVRAGVVEEVLNRMEAETGLIDAAMTLDNVIQTDHLARTCAESVMAERAG